MALAVLQGLLAVAGTGCSPSSFLARRMLSAPNRVPDFIKPAGRVWLHWPADVLDRFPTGTNVVGSPPAALRWMLVEPADYGLEIVASTWTNHGRVRPEFSLKFSLPKEGLPPAQSARGTAFVLHGYGMDLETMFPWALYLAEAGWRCVLVDLRGHGHSGGHKVGFGLVETNDLRELRLALSREGRVTEPCVAVGHSLGAVMALRWPVVDESIVAAIAFGPYAEFVPAVERLRDDYSPWVPRRWVRRAARRVPGLLGVDPASLDTVAALRKRAVRALLVASSDDIVTPPEDSQELRPWLAAGSEFLIVHGASHETLPYVFDQHGSRVKDWLDHVVEPGGDLTRR